MLNSKQIDLSSYPKGVTIFFSFKNISCTPFCIIIKDSGSNEIFYNRCFDKKDLTVNLPVHSQYITVLTTCAEINQYIVQPLRIRPIKYQFNEKIKLKRDYPIDKIHIQPVRGLPFGSEARFLYNEGIIQYDVEAMSKLAQPTRNFILRHELGHYYYGRPIPEPEALQQMPDSLRKHYHDISLEDEKECDKFSMYSCHNDGYNFSNITSGLMDTLTSGGTNVGHYNVDRILNVHNEIKRIDKNFHV